MPAPRFDVDDDVDRSEHGSSLFWHISSIIHWPWPTQQDDGTEPIETHRAEMTFLYPEGALVGFLAGHDFD